MKQSLVFIFFLSSTAWAVDDSVLSQLPKMSICKIKKIVRTLRVVANEAKECETYYTKLGKERSVGTAATNKGCLRFYENIKSNLGEAGWKCRELASVSYSKAKD